TSTSPLLAPVLRALLGPVDLVGFQGLANVNVKLGDIVAELGVVSADELLSTNRSVVDLAKALRNLLPRDGSAGSEVSALNSLISNGSTLNIGLGNILNYSVPDRAADDRVLETRVSAGQLLNAAMLLANQGSAISIPSLQINQGGHLVNVE